MIGPSKADVTKALAKAEGVSARKLTGAKAESLLSVDVYWRNTKHLEAMEFEDREFLSYAANRLAKEIKARSIRGRLPDGSASPPLSKRYAKAKVKRYGARPVRDFVRTGSMWMGFGIVGRKGKTAIRLGFSGAHKPSGKVTYVPTRGKYRGQTRTKNVSNQKIANMAALFTRGGRPLPENYRGDPGMRFIDASRKQHEWIVKEFERRVLRRNWAALPPDAELERM